MCHFCGDGGSDVRDLPEGSFDDRLEQDVRLTFGMVWLSKEILIDTSLALQYVGMSGLPNVVSI